MRVYRGEEVPWFLSSSSSSYSFASISIQLALSSILLQKYSYPSSCLPSSTKPKTLQKRHQTSTRRKRETLAATTIISSLLTAIQAETTSKIRTDKIPPTALLRTDDKVCHAPRSTRPQSACEHLPESKNNPSVSMIR